MKRILVYLNFVKGEKSEGRAVPEILVNEELTRLTRRTPQTQAEKAFHMWLQDWKEKIDRAGGQ
jgi:hypothetical protein